MAGFTKHAHAQCQKTSLKRAEQICADQKARLTPIRRRVLEILLENHRAMGAYDILERLRDEGLGSQPPVAYRALDFWVSLGLVHKVEAKNAFLACATNHDAGDPVLFICNECDLVEEHIVKAENSATSRKANEIGFAIDHTIREVAGTCPTCQKNS